MPWRGICTGYSMTNLPSFRPRQIIGRLAERGEVLPDIGFLRWLDLALRRTNELNNSRAPTGAVVATLGATEPESGWLLCNGQAVSKTDYADLYAVVGDTYGSTALTFNLPDLAGRTMIGADSIALKAFGGSNSITLTTAQLPAHSHGIIDTGHSHGVTDPGHTHSAAAVDAGTAEADAGSPVDGATAGTTGSATTGVTVNSATTGITVDSTGSGDAVDITPAAVGVNWLIKT